MKLNQLFSRIQSSTQTPECESDKENNGCDYQLRPICLMNYYVITALPWLNIELCEFMSRPRYRSIEAFKCYANRLMRGHPIL